MTILISVITNYVRVKVSILASVTAKPQSVIIINTLDAYSYTRLISTRAPSLKNTKSGFIFFRIGVLFSPKQSQRKASSYAG